MKRHLIVTLMLCSCASSPTEVVEVRSPVHAVAQAEPVRPPPTRFIVVSRNTKLHTAPDEDSHFIQYRAPEAQAEFETKQRERAVKKSEALQRKFQKEIDRETKRLKRFSTDEEAKAYALKRRKSRAKRYLNAINKRAKRSKEAHPNSRHVVLQIIEERDGWIKATTLGHAREGRHCYRDGLPGLRSAQVEFWVRKEALSSVTTRRETFQVWRGSEIKLAPGVALEKSGKHWIASVDGFRLRLKVPSDARSDRYSATGFFAAAYTDTMFTDIALAEGLLRIDRKQSLAFNPYFPLHVSGTLWVGKKFYATTQTPCAEITAHAEEKYLDAAGRRKALKLDHQRQSETRQYAAKATQFYWPNGEPAGTSIEDVALSNEVASREGRRCFSQEVWRTRKKKKRKRKKRKVNPAWAVEVCLNEADVKVPSPNP